MVIRIGANPIGWSNDDMRSLGGTTPLAVCLAEAREAGFSGMELGHKFPRQPDALKQALAPFELACVSGWHSAELLRRTPEQEFRVMRPHLDLLKAMGAEVVIVAETSNAIHGERSVPLSQRPQFEPRDWVGYGRRMTALADATLEFGLRLVYHHHMGTVVESAEDIRNFMDATGPSVHLLLDSGHATFGGADPVMLARCYRARISHVHAKDIRPEVMEQVRAKDMSFLDAVLAGVFTVPGDGMVDYPAFFQALEGYSGWVVVEAEQDPAKADPLTYAKMGYANLHRFLSEAGFSIA